jgi:hypothetical protein
MQKYKRGRKYKGLRSIPIRNPRRVNFPENWQKGVIKPLTQESLYVNRLWIEYNKERVARFITGEPKQEPRRVKLHSIDKYIEKWLFYLDKQYWIVEIHLISKIEYRSGNYTDKQEAMKAYHSNRYVCVSSKPWNPSS